MSEASPALGEMMKPVETAQLHPRPQSKIQIAMDKMRREATARGLSNFPWLTIATAATVSIGTPKTVAAVVQHIIATVPPNEVVETIEFMREVGMSCLVMNGIPRTAVMLMALRSSLSPYIRSALSTKPLRGTDSSNIESIQARGAALWTSIHGKFATAVEQKFTQAHPDLSSFAIGTMYGNGLRSGRVTISIGAISTLRAQPGFAPQVIDHVFGLKNAWRDGSWSSDEGYGEEEGMRWLLSDEGAAWILEKVDVMVEAIAHDDRSGLAQEISKL